MDITHHVFIFHISFWSRSQIKIVSYIHFSFVNIRRNYPLPPHPCITGQKAPYNAMQDVYTPQPDEFKFFTKFGDGASPRAAPHCTVRPACRVRRERKKGRRGVHAGPGARRVAKLRDRR